MLSSGGDLIIEIHTHSAPMRRNEPTARWDNSSRRRHISKFGVALAMSLLSSVG